ncbi:unnamed protein product [Colias eurytheme]|nr:unnamed protein product [Colias eurytheme]
MIRVSGCLSAMCDLFVTCMMHQDTWRALCRSLAEVCRGSNINQSHCAHLIPLCVQKIQRGDTNAVNVLQSLLTNHQQNNKLFHINDGMSIFTRDMIQDLSCLELLNTVIENLEGDCIEYILQAKQVFQELHNLTLSHGCCPQVIQWKTIIFYSCERERSGFETVESGKGLTNLTQCSTCNNTLELKEKMLFDPRLKDTVKKLKLGINLFGCNFKKISRTFWPNEKYMTPSLLYSLYRKLINKR